MNRFVRSLALGLAAFTVATLASAQAYPSKPIRLVVGFPAGGGVDLVARVVGLELQKALGQPVVIDNRAGAGGGIAAELVAKSPADGYTLLMGNTGSLTINPALYPNIKYDTRHDFAPIGLVASSPLALVVHPAVPAQSIADLVKRSKDTAMNYGTGGNGSISHLTVELLKMRSGARMAHVPYKGGAPAVTDLLGQQLQVVVDGVPLLAPYVKDRKLRALAVTSAARVASLPDVPTLVEAGFPDLVVTAWYGIVAPAGTPPEVVATLNKALNAAIATAYVRDNLRSQGSDAIGGTPAQFAEFLGRELDRWSGAVKASGAKVE